MKYYVVDVFTEERYHGNPAGVCVMDRWPTDTIMQKIAFENNLAETAFLVKNGDDYDLRWFTPEVEIDLCGHATLGSAYVLMNYIDKTMSRVEFHTMSGTLRVSREGERFNMDFPSRKPVLCEKPELLEKALGTELRETYQSRDLLAVVKDATTLAALKPDQSILKQINQFFGFIITAEGDDCDFVSRFFAPNAGIPEDPVTGSSHTTLIPFWSERLSKRKMIAKQLSERGGTLYCEDREERVIIGGTAVTHLIGEIIL